MLCPPNNDNPLKTFRIRDVRRYIVGATQRKSHKLKNPEIDFKFHKTLGLKLKAKKQQERLLLRKVLLKR